jgi:hypothetical protein
MPRVRLTDRPAIQGGAVVAPKIESVIALDAPRFLCPKTDREVDSGIRLSPGTRLISLRFRCPACEGVHEWQVAHQSVGTVLEANHRASGARHVKPQSAPQDIQYPRAEFVELKFRATSDIIVAQTSVLYCDEGIISPAVAMTVESRTHKNK